jgi:hypothetical protein
MLHLLSQKKRLEEDHWQTDAQKSKWSNLLAYPEGTRPRACNASQSASTSCHPPYRALVRPDILSVCRSAHCVKAISAMMSSAFLPGRSITLSRGNGSPESSGMEKWPPHSRSRDFSPLKSLRLCSRFCKRLSVIIVGKEKGFTSSSLLTTDPL